MQSRDCAVSRSEKLQIAGFLGPSAFPRVSELSGGGLGGARDAGWRRGSDARTQEKSSSSTQPLCCAGQGPPGNRERLHEKPGLEQMLQGTKGSGQRGRALGTRGPGWSCGWEPGGRIVKRRDKEAGSLQEGPPQHALLKATSGFQGFVDEESREGIGMPGIEPVLGKQNVWRGHPEQT